MIEHSFLLDILNLSFLCIITNKWELEFESSYERKKILHIIYNKFIFIIIFDKTFSLLIRVLFENYK